MLRNGNPNVPGPAGAVLEYRTQIAKATLLPKSSTPLMSINNQFLFYVVSGEGRLDDGTQSWDLHNGITMLIPPDVKRRFVNTSNEPLEMVMVEWPANAIARKDILVRDVTLLPYCEENAHWNNMSKCVFTQADGMTGRVLLVMLMPMTMAAPHPHVPGTEEIWTKLTPGNALLLLGSELREHAAVQRLPGDPPNGNTWHGQMNPSKTQVEMWLYVAGGNATAAPQARCQSRCAAAAAARRRSRRAAIRICREIRRSSIRRTSKASRSSSARKRDTRGEDALQARGRWRFCRDDLQRESWTDRAGGCR